MIKISRKGFSIAEVVVASVIFLIASAGVFATISVSRRPASVSDARLRAAILSKKVADELRRQIDSNAWVLGNFTAGGPYAWPADADFTGYNATYTVNNMPDGTKRVDVDVTW